LLMELEELAVGLGCDTGRSGYNNDPQVPDLSNGNNGASTHGGAEQEGQGVGRSLLTP
jgi:hypothetical protein